MHIDDFFDIEGKPSRSFDCVVCQNPSQIAAHRVSRSIQLVLALGGLGVAGLIARVGYRRWRRSRNPSPPLG